MGQIATAVKAVLSLGGTGSFVASRQNDPVYVDLADYLHGGGSKVTADKALNYIPFYAAVRIISADLAVLPLKIYRDLPGGGREEYRAHPAFELLYRKANPFMSAFTFRSTLQAHVLTWGNGYAEIEYNTDGTIRALWPLRPDRTEVKVADGKPFYRYTHSDGTHTDLPQRKVYHVHGLGFDGLVGYSVISRAQDTLKLAVTSGKYGQNWFDRGGVPPAVLTHPKTLSDTARKNLRESIDNGTLSDRQRMALLEEGLDIKVLGIPPGDAAFIETTTNVRDLMPTLFRIPPHMLGFVERSTSWGSGIEEQGLGYVSFTLGEWIVNWEQESNIRLLPGEDAYYKHRVDHFLRGRARDRWANYKDGLTSGVYSIDDVLAMEDMNPLPDGLGQRRFVPLNMAPLDQVGAMTIEQRIAALGGLVRAGFDPADAADVLGVPEIDHTGLEPVTVSEQGDYIKMAEFRCPDCRSLINRKAAPGTIGHCRKCGVERVAA